jgi:hypothetical protein
MRPDSPHRLSTSLVDVDFDALDWLFGAGTSEKYMGARKAAPPTGRQEDMKASGAAVLASVGTFVSNVRANVAEKTAQSQVGSPDLWGGSLEDIGKKFSMFGTTAFAGLKKGVVQVSSAAAAAAAVPTTSGFDDECDARAHGGTWQPSNGVSDSGAATTQQARFVIDDDDDDDDDERYEEGGDFQPPPPPPPPARIEIPDTNTVSVQKTDAEKALALAIHRLSGVSKGDQLVILKENLPGAILFPAMKEKEVRDENGEVILVIGPDGKTPQPVTSSIHRYLVITKERFIVLDSGGKGIGSTADVKSNHHLTSLIKITFKKRDPELVTLFISDPSKEGGMKKHAYRVVKRKEFVATLQVRLFRYMLMINTQHDINTNNT